jgi:hypothetical protein
MAAFAAANMNEDAPGPLPRINDLRRVFNGGATRRSRCLSANFGRTAESPEC